MSNKLQRSNTEFGINLLREAYAQSGDKTVQVSPLSVRRALTMAAIGSRGATRRAFLDTFQLPSGVDLSEVNQNNNAFLNALLSAENGAKAPTEINVANALWLKKDDGRGYRFLDSFKEDNQRYYGAPATELNFDPGDVAIINAWCKESTKKIDKILEAIPDGARAFLTDALYMKTPAQKRFRKAHDTKGEFTPLNGSPRPITFMSQQWEKFAYLNTGDVEVLQFPFGEFGTFHYYLLLPSKQSSLNSLVSALDGTTWFDWKTKLRNTDGMLRLPPNEQEFSSDLKDVLCCMGLDIAFNNELADFLDMCTGRLKIGAVQHKTFTKFVRKGFEGAAVTCVAMMECTSIGPSRDPFDITVDRPYAWLVEGNGEILFAATTTDPKEPAEFATETDEDDDF